MKEREESGVLYSKSSPHDQSYESVETEKCELKQEISSIGDNDLSSDNKIHLHEQLPIYIDRFHDAVAIVDFNGVIQYCNQRFLHILDYNSPSELEGLHISTIISDDSFKLFEKEQNQTVIDRGGFFSPYLAQKKNGSIIWIDGISCKVCFNQHPAYLFFIRDISDQIKSLDYLKRLGKKFRLISDLSENGIVILDSLGKITYVNKSFIKMSNRNENDLNNRLFRELLTGDSIYQFQQLLLQLRKHKENIKNIQLNLEVDFDDFLPVQLSIAPIFENESFNGYICIISDIKERKLFEDKIKKSERLKTEFMNIAAHELKSPVTPIKGYLDLIISDEDSNEKIKNWAKISLRNADRLLCLVDDILDVSRLDNDTMSFEMRRINLNALFHEIIEDMKPAIQQKNLMFNENIQSNLPDILGDYHRLSQVLRNLLTNAIKFTDEGLISLNAFQKGGNLVFEVIDTGIGINLGELDQVFTKFFQAETGEDRKNEGTGLGLFICKEIIKRHHGDIQVNSQVGGGSTFTVTLPTL
jgi:PAS domain S-box-containing protein